MTSDEICAFLNANPVCYLATVDEGRPRVRGMMLARADSEGVLFHAGAGKAMIRQLEECPEAELCAFNPQDNMQVRVHGRVVFLNDLTLKQQLVAEREFLQQIIDRIGWDNFLVFRMVDCEASVWTMQTSMELATWAPL